MTSIRDDRRASSIDLMADHLLREGMGGASLRPLAAAVGTSDRMLLYYFTDKDELLTVTLGHVAARLLALLDATLLPDPPRSDREFLREVWAALRLPSFEPYMNLWLELAAGAARAQEPHRATAGRIADGFLHWTATRLKGGAEERARSAACVLATVEGLLVLKAVGRTELADVAAEAW